MKKVILSILVILWMILIFIFSNQNGIQSSKTSDSLSEKAVHTVEVLRNKKYSKVQRKKILKKVVYFVRKTAHFTEYFILGLLVYLLFREYKLDKVYLWTILFCASYAITDEIHQLFINERTAKILDVFIDISGSIISTLIIYITEKIKTKKDVVKRGKLC